MNILSYRKIIFYFLFVSIVFYAFNKFHFVKDELAAHVDSTISPGNDFFMFANGKWFKNNPIPSDRASNGIFQIVYDTVSAQIRSICETSMNINNVEKGSNRQKIGDLFYSGMDSVTLNKKGISELVNDFARIDAISDLNGLVTELAYINKVSASPMFDFSISQDDRNSSKYVVYLSQGGLSLPDRTFYFDKDKSTSQIRKKFKNHLLNAFKILGYSNKDAKISAENLFKLETDLAKVSRNTEDTRDPLKNYNKMAFYQLSKLMPDFNWKLFTEKTGLYNVDTVIVGQPEFFVALNGYLKTYSLKDWKDYLKYNHLCGLSDYVDDKTYLEFFDFYSRTLDGQKEPSPRWERVVNVTDGELSDLVGQVYVEEYLPKGAKGKLLEIGNAVKSAYAERIKNLDWMSNSTKKVALEKLASLKINAGYPDKWKDMSSVKISRVSYLKNVMSSSEWAFNYMISHYGKPVNRNEWYMGPQDYNAYYDPSNNLVCVPGCNIIIPGYEHKLADDAILYSIIGGSTFGHEMTHGFDDQGSKYDLNGNLFNWWTKEDSTKFYSKTSMIVKQYNNYTVADGIHINGENTQGEAIADLGGLILGFEAFKKTNQFKANSMISGFTPSQRFFLAFGFAWMMNIRQEALITQVKSDEHPPAKFRVNGTLSNIPEFYKAFTIKEGDYMWLPDSLIVKIW